MTVKTRSKKRARRDEQSLTNSNPEFTSDLSGDSESDHEIREAKNIHYSKVKKEIAKKPLKQPTSLTKVPKNKPTDWSIHTTGLGLLALLLVGVVAYMYQQNSDQNINKNTFPYKFKIFLENIKSKLSGQDEKIWKIINASVKPVMEHRGKGPSVVMLATTPGAQNITSCLAWSLANSITEAQGHSAIQQSIKYDGQTKYNMDMQIKTHLDATSSIIIENLEKFPYDSFSLLQGYCDDQFPPYKIAFFILTVNCDETYNEGTFDKYAGKKLRETWADVSPDNIEPIITRITRSVVVVRNDELPNNCNYLHH